MRKFELVEALSRSTALLSDGAPEVESVGLLQALESWRKGGSS